MHCEILEYVCTNIVTRFNGWRNLYKLIFSLIIAYHIIVNVSTVNMLWGTLCNLYYFIMKNKNMSAINTVDPGIIIWGIMNLQENKN